MDITNIYLECVDSTNQYAKMYSEGFDPNQITCIIADEQTAGRGRFNRQWHSPKGQNIYVTFFFRLPIHTLHLTCLAQLMTLGIAMVLLREGVACAIKWPNDIQVKKKKMAGVLCETRFHSHDVEIFLGAGINVNMTEDHLSRINQPATSLHLETGHEWNRADLLKKCQKQFVADLQQFKKEGFTPFRRLFENLLAYKGQTVRCFDGDHEWIGICHSITADGQLNIYLPNKEIHTIRSGDLDLGSVKQ
jgi:BirA family biotin operon repressor/biotin-[acetyl-CoA-carboxylase] ligase